MTFNQVISRLSQIFEAHNQVRTFRYTPRVTDLLTDSTVIWPLAALQDQPSSFDIGAKNQTCNFRLFLLDLVNVSADAKENEQDVMSDMVSVAKDILAVINHSSFTDWKLAPSIAYQYVTEGGDALYAGVYVDLNIILPLELDRCEGPIDDLPIISTMNIQKFTTSANWVKPAGAKWVKAILTAGGGGGASGQKTSANGVGGGAGAGGAVVIAEFDPEDLSDTVLVTIGSGGAGGASITTNSTNGTGGSSGGRTSFGGFMSAGGGTGGVGGGVAGASNAPGGNGGVNLVLTGVSGNQGGIGRNTTAPDPGKAVNHACTGGGGGGGITSSVPGDGADAQYRGGESSVANGPDTIHLGGTGGTVGAILNGTDGSAFGFYGTGGGGGAASITTNAGAGGRGVRGGGGGGGGSARNDIGNSGAGGRGGDGYAIIITYL